MGKIIRHATLENIPFWVFAIISAGIGIASFVVPPPGEIHPSVLKFISWMFAFAALWVFMRAFKEGMDARLTHGNTKLEIGTLNETQQHQFEQETEESEE